MDCWGRECEGAGKECLRMGSRVEGRLWIEKPSTKPLEVERYHGMAQAKLGTMSSWHGKTHMGVQSKRWEILKLGFKWLVNWVLGIKAHIFLFAYPLVPNSCKYTGLYFPLCFGLYNGMKRSLLEDARPNPHPAVSSCFQLWIHSCWAGITICHVIWSVCFTLDLNVFQYGQRQNLKGMCFTLFAYKSGAGKTKSQEHLSQLQELAM